VRNVRDELQTSIIRFAGFELDAQLFQLRRGAEVQKLEPKVFDLLAYLVRHRDRVVAKEELLEQLWPGEHVSESVLPTNVRTLRRVLGDERGDPRFIQTVYGRGYRFVAPIDADEPASATPRPELEPPHPFVGREDELAKLREAWAAAVTGRGGIALVVGEAGIGKTRLAEEIVREARDHGALALSGRCQEGEGAPAFWPWVQVLREALADRTPPEVHRELGREHDAIAPLLPELVDSPAADHTAGLTSEQRRFQLFDAVARYLRRCARARPLVILLDDLHWGDQASLLLLRFLAGELRASAALLLATYRDEELHRGHPLPRIVAALAREPFVRRVHLQGLRPEEVARYLETLAPDRATPALAAELHERTGGNPFFLREMIDLIEGDGAPPTALPEGVREAIGRRLDRLSPEGDRILTVAALIGDGFSLALLEQVADVERERLLEILDEAQSCGVLRAADRSGARFVFAHALVRQTLYEEVSAPARVRLHRKVGEALEATHRDNPGPFVGELAHHFFQAAAGGDVAKAVQWGRRAADRAMRLLAWEEAAAQYERVLEILSFATPVDERARCETLLDLGEACSRAGERTRAREAFTEAGEAADALGAATLLARAALGLGGRAEEGHGPDEPLRRLLEKALGAVGASDAALRAALLARLSGTHPYSASRDERARISEEALALARSSGARWALTQAVVARATDLRLGDVAERLALGAELIATAERADDAPWGLSPYDPAWVGHSYRERAFLLQGDVAAADRELAVLARIAEEQRQPFQRFAVCTANFGRAHASGRFEEARRWIDRAQTIARRLDPLATTMDRVLEFLLARECGPELLPAVMITPDVAGALLDLPLDRLGWESSEEAPSGERIREVICAVTPWMGPIIGAIMGHAKMQAGRVDEARAELEAMTDRFDETTQDGAWIFFLALAAEAAARVDSRAPAERLYALLEPHAHLNASLDGMDAYLGSVSHFLGVLAAALSERERALAHLEEAVTRNDRMGARAHRVRSEWELGRVLLEVGERARGHALLESARAEARSLGMNALLA
jgi:DNA-binding winged helix-turn-helix (wHTH) protein/tetratricopeptide (TPR) repeat protein